MSATKFTPGPWVAVAGDRWRRGDAPIFSDGIWSIYPEGYRSHRTPICVVDKGNDHDDETREHAEFEARLIAAAPELLAALDGVLRVADRKTAEFDAARAALAKARGEVPAQQAV